MCTPEHYYPSDLTDEQWALIEPHLPLEAGGGRPRATDMRDVVDAILSILRTGCQWRYLSGDLPPKSTVWRYFDRWRRDGVLDAIHDRLRAKARAVQKPYHPRTTASVDGQSGDTTSGGESRGRDNAHGRHRPSRAHPRPGTKRSQRLGDDAGAGPPSLASPAAESKGRVAFADGSNPTSRVGQAGGRPAEAVEWGSVTKPRPTSAEGRARS